MGFYAVRSRLNKFWAGGVGAGGPCTVKFPGPMSDVGPFTVRSHVPGGQGCDQG